MLPVAATATGRYVHEFDKVYVRFVVCYESSPLGRLYEREMTSTKDVPGADVRRMPV
jgi:hypothetical protein